MPLPRKTINDYQQLAKDNDLTYLEGFAPSTVWVRVRWQCNRCNRVLYKNYHTLNHQMYACRCRNNVSVPVTDYHLLAGRLGIEFIHEYVPHNIYQPVQWRLADGRVIEVCYRDLDKTYYLDRIDVANNYQ